MFPAVCLVEHLGGANIQHIYLWHE